VPRCRRGLAPPRSVRPALDIADIFRTHGEAYRQRHTLSREQRATMRALVTCRTAALGGHLDVCDHCGYARPAYNSCRNRHCPKCDALREARWIEARMARLVPCPYFHVVFTLPAALRPLVLRNRKRLFTLHVLPRGFVKIRHGGLFAPGATAAREHARRLLGAPPADPATAAPREDWRTLLHRLTGVDLAHCPRCARGTMVAMPLPSFGAGPVPGRAPPALACA